MLPLMERGVFMKRRWFIYFLIGIVFGVIDFYYHGFLSNFLGLQQITGLWGRVAWSVLSIGIWLVPIISIILHEAKVPIKSAICFGE